MFRRFLANHAITTRYAVVTPLRKAAASYEQRKKNLGSSPLL